MTSTAAESAAQAVHSLAFNERLVEIRRHLHRHPELSGEEVETTAYITSLLNQAGVKITDYGLKTGVIAEVGGQHGGPVIALRADIDALPIQEETGLTYASEVHGRMHACGHDFHTAALLGAVYQLKAQESSLKGTVRLLFQPAEEKAKGAQQIIAAGGLDQVRAVIGMHNKPDLPVGTIGIKAGPLMAAADGFAVRIRGFGSHAAVPEAGIDPIVAASHIVTALQSIVSRNVGSLDSAVISVTQIHSGNSWNIIPDTTVLEGTIRSFDEAVRGRVLKRFEEVVRGVAAALELKPACAGSAGRRRSSTMRCLPGLAKRRQRIWAIPPCSRCRLRPGRTSPSISRRFPVCSSSPAQPAAGNGIIPPSNWMKRRCR